MTLWEIIFLSVQKKETSFKECLKSHLVEVTFSGIQQSSIKELQQSCQQSKICCQAKP